MYTCKHVPSVHNKGKINDAKSCLIIEQMPLQRIGTANIYLQQKYKHQTIS